LHIFEAKGSQVEVLKRVPVSGRQLEDESARRE